MTGPLIAALEQAVEGSRELDEQIHDLLCASKFRTCIKGLSDEDGGLWMYEFPGHAASSALRVTTSLDAALALAERVLPGWYVGVQANRYELLIAPEDWSAYLSTPKGHDFKGEVEGSAMTPALALCAAILRATNPKGQPNV